MKNEKKIYSAPEFELMAMNTEDVITTSEFGDQFPGEEDILGLGV